MHMLDAETLRAKTQRKHTAVLAEWQASELPEWHNEEAYRTRVRPALAKLTVLTIVNAQGVSLHYATDICAADAAPKALAVAGAISRNFGSTLRFPHSDNACRLNRSMQHLITS
jgi:hypothetical protein